MRVSLSFDGRSRGSTLVIRAEESVDVSATASSIVAWMRDINRYRAIDPKMRRVLSIQWNDDEARLRFIGQLRHIPSPPVAVIVRIDGNEGVEVTSDPDAWQTRLVRFRGSYRFEPSPSGGTRIHHCQQFSFRGPLAWILDPYLRRWHERTTRDQLTALGRAVESPVDPPV